MVILSCQEAGGTQLNTLESEINTISPQRPSSVDNPSTVHLYTALPRSASGSSRISLAQMAIFVPGQYQPSIATVGSVSGRIPSHISHSRSRISKHSFTYSRKVVSATPQSLVTIHCSFVSFQLIGTPVSVNESVREPDTPGWSSSPS